MYYPQQQKAKYHPSACSWGSKRLDVYYMSASKTCHYKYRDYGHKEQKYQSWSDWEDLGGEMDSPPAVCSRKKENYHVFCKGTDGQAWHKGYDYGSYGGWGKWQSMGGKIGKYGEPATCSWGKEHVSVYVGAEDGACWTKKYDEGYGGWQGWYNIGGYMASPPKVVTYEKGHTSVYCKGEDGQAWHKKTDPKKETGWGEWESLGGSLESTPAACAWEDGRMDVVVKGSDGACWHKTYKNETVMVYDEKSGKNKTTTLPKWGSWENLGGEMKTDTAPDVVAVDGGMEVYITGGDDVVYRKKWEDGSWTSPDWERMGGNVETGPNAVKWGDGEVDVYFTGKNGDVARCFS